MIIIPVIVSLIIDLLPICVQFVRLMRVFIIE